MVVADTSAVVDYLLGTSLSEWVAPRIEAGGQIHAPHVLDVEVLGVLRRLVIRGHLPPGRAQEALDDQLQLRVVRHGHRALLSRMWQLRDNVSPRDAAFVALAELLGAPIVTTDRRLARAPGLGVEILSP